MPSEEVPAGFVQETIRRLRIIQKAARKNGFEVGGVTLVYDLTGGSVSGTFVFPIEQTDDPETGASIVRGADFIEMPES